MKTVALIPARTGSKGVPNKNFRDLCGKQLWRWAYEIGEGTCDSAWVSTDAPWLCADANVLSRPPELAQDDTPMLPVVVHAAEFLKFDVMVILQPTQPLREAWHVLEALGMLEDHEVDSVLSVVEGPSPDWTLSLEHGVRPVRHHDGDPFFIFGPSRRQDCRPAFYRDGTVYAFRRETLERYGALSGEKNRALIIPPSQSCNIDTEHDWHMAELLKRERINA